MKPRRIVYSYLFADLFHYGHLMMLKKAKESADYHICGVISDRAASQWFPTLICNYDERKTVIENIGFVDEVLSQDSLDPTENLKKIRHQYPESELMLVQGHILGSGGMLGIDYIREINGEIIRHDFYSNLSRDYIAKVFFNEIVGERDRENMQFTDIKLGDIRYLQENFSTKADTLKNLKSLLKQSEIEKVFVFTTAQWDENPDLILTRVVQLFDGGKIVVRSSSRDEDALNNSNAGHYKSILDVDASDRERVKEAVEQVMESYCLGGHLNPLNQVLVQPQTMNVKASGVVFTRNLWTNTPYYLINFDENSSKTDTVTGGLSGSKVEILRDVPLPGVDEKWRNLVLSVREIESFFGGTALDIEFALNGGGRVVIFQVRPLAANSRFHSLDDDRVKQSVRELQEKFRRLSRQPGLLVGEVYLSDMAFWNPAELIGDRPNHLDYSLFNHLIMKKTWNRALLSLGYTEVEGDLLVLMGNKPYINVYNAFLSLLPAGLSVALKKKLLDFYHNKLKRNPHLHDKVEFEVVHNCFRFDFDRRSGELRENGFSGEEIGTLKDSLLRLTNDILDGFAELIRRDIEGIGELEWGFTGLEEKVFSCDRWEEKLEAAAGLVEACKETGTLLFSRVARLAFMGNAFLKSMAAVGIIGAGDVDTFLNSIETVATEMDGDFARLRNRGMEIGDFIKKYGHLRPGTYDVTRLPYSKNRSYFDMDTILPGPGGEEPANLHTGAGMEKAIEEPVDRACREHGLRISGAGMLDFIRTSIRLREWFKFVYTKNISLALELIADVGEEMGFGREELSHLDYYSIVDHRRTCSREELIEIWGRLIRGRKEKNRVDNLVSLPSIIYSAEDLTVVPSYVSRPNFITDAEVRGDIVKLDEEKERTNINGKIVVLEKADPGYDWIFTRRIKGLITRYGGAGSHMAIRCAEFQIPAAIGCGDVLFSKIKRAGQVLLDGKNKTIHVL